MPFTVTPGLGLVSIILFLLPGLAGVKYGLQRAERGDWLNRIDTIALSFAVTLFSMVLLYLVFSATNSILVGEIHFVTRAELQMRVSPIPWLIFHYLSLVATSLLVGGLLGTYDFGRRYFSSNLLWRRFFSLAEEQRDGGNYVVRVQTVQGDEIRGRVKAEGETTISKDVILQNPSRERFDEDGKVVEEYPWTGLVYIHNQNVAHIEVDRLEDADEAEAREVEGEPQLTLREIEEREGEDEMRQLEAFAEEEDGSESDDTGVSDESQNNS